VSSTAAGRIGATGRERTLYAAAALSLFAALAHLREGRHALSGYWRPPQILGGAALLSGLYSTWRTLQVNREGQITERFTRAIDQLGQRMIRKTHDLRYVLAVSTPSNASLVTPPGKGRQNALRSTVLSGPSSPDAR
jgi:hypothetical protein